MGCFDASAADCCCAVISRVCDRWCSDGERRAEGWRRSGWKCQEWREAFCQLWLLFVPRAARRRFVGYRAAPGTERGYAGPAAEIHPPAYWADASLHHEGRLGRRPRGHLCVFAVSSAAAQGGQHSRTEVAEPPLRGAFLVCPRESGHVSCARDDRPRVGNPPV